MEHWWIFLIDISSGTPSVYSTKQFCHVYCLLIELEILPISSDTICERILLFLFYFDDLSISIKFELAGGSLCDIPFLVWSHVDVLIVCSFLGGSLDAKLQGTFWVSQIILFLSVSWCYQWTPGISFAGILRWALSSIAPSLFFV